MARIKGKWVGQVVIEMSDEIDKDYEFENEKHFFTKTITEIVDGEIRSVMQPQIDRGMTVTVTQLHADLYRDEPSEWTKEEAI